MVFENGLSKYLFCHKELKFWISLLRISEIFVDTSECGRERERERERERAPV